MEQLHTLKHEAGAIDPLRSLAFPARLMAPHEVTEAFAMRGQALPPELKGQWSLCGSASTSMFDDIETSGPPRLMLRLSVFMTPLGGAYLVLTHQLGSRQHRFLLPLWDAHVRQGVKALHAGRLNFMLARADGELAKVFSSGLTPAEVEPLFEHRLPSEPDTLLALTAEMRQVVPLMRQMQAIPSFQRPGPIEEVALSVLLPVQAAMSVVLGRPQTA